MVNESCSQNQKFHDYYANGKGERPWDEKKKANVHYANLIMNGCVEGYSLNMIGSIDDCGNTLRFYRDKKEGRLHLYQTFFCHDRLCPLCSWRMARKRSIELSEMLRIIHDEKPNAKFLFITFTLPNVKGEDLRDTVENMNVAINRMMHYKKVKKNIIGYVKKIEITVNREKLNVVNGKAEPARKLKVYDAYKVDKENQYAINYHPHVHLLVVVSSTFFKNSDNYIPTKEWSKLWEKALRWEGQDLVCFAEKIHAKKGQKNITKDDEFVSSALEASKYTTKQKDYLKSKDCNSATADVDRKIIGVLHNSLKHLRLYSYGGRLRELYKQMGYDENDLINAKAEKEETNDDDFIQTVVATWNSKNKGYYITENKVEKVSELKKDYEDRKKNYDYRVNKLVESETQPFHEKVSPEDAIDKLVQERRKREEKKDEKKKD